MAKYTVQTQEEVPNWEEGQTTNHRRSWRWPWSACDEQPKAVASGSRFRALWRCLIILSPLPLTITVLGLNVLKYYCFDFGYSHQNSILDALQFVAKIHDILITASLSAIVLHRVLYDLTMGDGLALAILTPAYQLNQPSFMFKWAFWSEIFSRGRISLGILMTIAVFLANLAAPTAAIAILPKAGWWPVPSKLLQSTLGYNSVGPFFLTNSTPVWPDEVSASYLPTNMSAGSCLSSWGILEESCPAAGYVSIATSLLNDNFQTNGLWSVLLSNDDISRSLVSVNPDYFGTNFNRNQWSITSSVSQIMASSLWNYDGDDSWMMTLGYEGTPLLKPLVQVECSVSDNSTLIFPHSYIPFPNINSTNEEWILDTNDGWNSFISQNSSDVHFMWAGLESVNPGPSLVAAFNINNTDNRFNFTDDSGAVHLGNNQTAFLCSVDARWAPVKMWMLPGSDFDYRVHESTPYDMDGSFGFLYGPDDISSLQQIQIDPAWAASLNIALPNSTASLRNSTTILTMEQIIRIAISMNTDVWSKGTTDEFLNLVSVGIGMMITDGLARLSWSDEFVALVSDSSGTYLQSWESNVSQDNINMAPNINPDWLVLNFASFREGWSYGLADKTVKFALAILLLHLVLAVIHTVIIVGSRDVWTTKSWRSVGDLLVLAINSNRSEKLQNTSAGVSQSSTWRKTVKIRETEQGHLGLVIDDDRSGDVVELDARQEEKPKPGKLYG